MAGPAVWRSQAKWFFEDRAEGIRNKVTPESLCYVSGREQRLWTNPVLYRDLMLSIQEQLELTPACSLLEVGCAAGFLAQGLAPLVGRYHGVDVASHPIEVARSLRIPLARFQTADGTQLPWPAESFERVLCYDVFTNFPSFESVADVVREMARVTRCGGKLMAGSLPNEERKEAFLDRVQQVMAKLDREHGPVKPVEERVSLGVRLRHWLSRKLDWLKPHIVCYYFRANDFRRLGQELGLITEIYDIHPLNPYHGFRFNVVYTKPESR